MPALFTRMSILPAFPNACSMEAAEPRSTSTHEELEIDAEASSSFAVSRAASTTRQPQAASARAQARPIPRLAPVTKAVLFVILDDRKGSILLAGKEDGLATRRRLATCPTSWADPFT